LAAEIVHSELDAIKKAKTLYKSCINNKFSSKINQEFTSNNQNTVLDKSLVERPELAKNSYVHLKFNAVF
jgi:hypothetical protein